jgi:hypothetical protein
MDGTSVGVEFLAKKLELRVGRLGWDGRENRVRERERRGRRGRETHADGDVWRVGDTVRRDTAIGDGSDTVSNEQRRRRCCRMDQRAAAEAVLMENAEASGGGGFRSWFT